MRLLLSSRSWDDIIYRDELDRLSGRGLTVVHTLTRAQPPGWTGYARRVDADMLAEVGPEPDGAATHLRLRPDAVRRGRRGGAGRAWPRATARSRPSASARREAEMDALMLDGNAVAGLLKEVFGMDMTTAIATCASCGAGDAVGATHVYRGGVVLRCPYCDNVLAKIVTRRAEACVDLSGLRMLAMT